MEYPVCLADSCVGTLYVCPRGEETELRAVCRGTEKGLYRLYVQGNRGEVLLGVTEDGGLRRCFPGNCLLLPGNCAAVCCGRAAAKRRNGVGFSPDCRRWRGRRGRDAVCGRWSRGGRGSPSRSRSCSALQAWGRDG